MTALATLLVAIAGLVAAVKHLGVASGGSKVGAVATEATSSSFADYPPDLRSAIPAKILPTCHPSRGPGHPEETAVAAANCTYREVVNLQYNLFASDVELRQDVANVRKRWGDKHEYDRRAVRVVEADRRLDETGDWGARGGASPSETALALRIEEKPREGRRQLSCLSSLP